MSSEPAAVPLIIQRSSSQLIHRNVPLWLHSGKLPWLKVPPQPKSQSMNLSQGNTTVHSNRPTMHKSSGYLRKTHNHKGGGESENPIFLSWEWRKETTDHSVIAPSLMCLTTTQTNVFQYFFCCSEKGQKNASLMRLAKPREKQKI